MRKLITAIFLIGCFHSLNAQQNHFVYIQSDDKQPFAVSVNNKEYTASSIGYVIIPKLQDGNYNLTVSFPKQSVPRQEFEISVSKDAGYSLKNFGEKGWGLFNLNSLDITMAGNKKAGDIAQKPKSNAFGDMLSGAVNDESIKDIAAAKPAVEPAASNPKQEETAVATPVAVNKEAEVKAENPVAGIELLKKNKSAEGMEMIFVDPTSTAADTVKIYLAAAEQPKVTTEDKVASAPGDEPVSEGSKNEETVVSGKEKTDLNNPFYNSTQNNPVQPESAAPAGNTSTPPAAVNAFRDECDDMFTGSELEKLRKKMIGANSDDKMTALAEKAIGKKCIISKQVRNLGPLYLSDAARFRFFSAMYPHVYDLGAFAGLENQLIDPDYKDKFRQLFK